MFLCTVAPVSLVSKKTRSRWFGHVERKDDIDWVMELKELDSINNPSPKEDRVEFCRG